jgi:hypothetical protein
VDPPDRRSTTDDSERGGAPGGHPTSTASAALPAIAKPSPL